MLRIYAQALDRLCVCLNMYLFNAWFPPFHCHSAVAVSPLQLRKFRKNYVSAVRITLLMWKNPFHHCHCHLPLRGNRLSVANRIESYFCRSVVGGQPISVLVTSSLCIRKDVSGVSVLTCNGSYGTEERQWHNGMAERNGEMATEWWKLGISVIVQSFVHTGTTITATTKKCTKSS